jgi:Fe-S-cluster containining protein
MGVSLSKSELALILRKVGTKLAERFKKDIAPHPNNPEYIWLKTDCMFYSDKKKKCLIYTIRPFACRLFMCGRQSEGEPLVYSNNRCVNNILRRKRDPYFHNQVMMNREKAFAWGLSHGWKKGDFL